MADYKVVDAEQLDADLETVANAIREQTGNTDPIAFPNGFASAPAELVEVGRQKEWSDFWDVYQSNGARKSYAFVFRDNWNEVTMRPKYDMFPTSAEQMFAWCSFSGDLVEHLNGLGVVLDFSNCTNFFMCFQNSKIKRVGVIGSAVAKNVTQICGWAESLVTVDKFIVNENIEGYSNSFAGCWALKNLAMEGTAAKSISFSNSPITATSAKSVISCLKNFTGTGKENTTTVTFHSKTWEYLDAEGNASPDGKTWRDYITTTLCWNT